MLENKIVKPYWYELGPTPYTINIGLDVPSYMRKRLLKLDEPEVIKVTSNNIQKPNKKKQTSYDYMFSVLYGINGQLAWSPSKDYTTRDDLIVHSQFKDKDGPVKLGNVELSDIVRIFLQIYKILTKEDVTSGYIIKNHSEDLNRILGDIKKHKNKILTLTKN